MPPSEKSPTENRRSGCGCLIIGVVMIISVPLLWFTSWYLLAARRLDAELSRLRAAGQPTSAPDLNQLYEQPAPDEDTTQLWLDGMAPLQTPEFLAKARAIPGLYDANKSPWTAAEWPQLPAVRQLLLDCAFSLDKFHEAAEKGGHARYTILLQPSIYAKPEHGLKLRGSAMLLRTHAHVLARDGDAHAAAGEIHTILMMARSLENEPPLGAQEMRWVVFSLGIRSLEELLPHIEFSAADLQKLQVELRAANWRRGLQRGLASDRALGLEFFKNPHNVRMLLPVSMGEHQVMNTDDLVLYLQLSQRLIDAANEDWHVAVPAATNDLTKYRTTHLKSSRVRAISHRFSQEMLVGAESTFPMFARAEAATLCADAAIAVELYRHEHGTLPTTLDDLVPDFLPQVPLDPFDGQPIRFVERDGGYVIYSVGNDGVDNHGEPQQDVMNELPFTVKRPPQN